LLREVVVVEFCKALDRWALIPWDHVWERFGVSCQMIYRYWCFGRWVMVACGEDVFDQKTAFRKEPREATFE